MTRSSVSSSKKVALGAMLLGAALLLSRLEALFTPFSPIPSLKPGLANIAVTLAVMLISRRMGLAVMLARVGITSMLFGSVTSLMFSLFGGLAALAVSALHKQSYFNEKIGLVGISVLSAAAHNFGQILAACLVFSSSAPLGMLWWLLLSSIPTGMLTGALSELAIRRLGKILKKSC